jgi:hypothetical protein
MKAVIGKNLVITAKQLLQTNFALFWAIDQANCISKRPIQEVF